MKRTIKHPDGRVEEQEGTPEELAKFDRDSKPDKIWIGPVAPAKPDESPPFWPSPGIRWEVPVKTGGGCLFDGLPDGAYMLSCPCPLHSWRCHA